MGLKHRIVGGVLLVVVASGAAGGYAFVQASRTTAQADRAEASVRLADVARDYQEALGDLHSSVLRYGSTNAQADRDAVGQAIADLKTEMERLSGLLSGPDAEQVSDGASAIVETIAEALDRLKIRRESLEAVLLGMRALGENLVKLQDLLQKAGGDGIAVSQALGGQSLALLAQGARFTLSGAAAELEAARTSIGQIRDSVEAAKPVLADLPRSEKEPLRYFGRDLDLFRDGLAQYEAASLGYLEALARIDHLLGEGLAAATTVAEREQTASMTLAGELRDGADHARMLILAASMTALAIGLGIATLMAGNIVRPLERLRRCMEAIGGGRFDIDIADGGRRDEIGAMATTLATMRESLSEAERLRHRQTETERRAAAERKAAIERMAVSVERDANDAVAAVAGHSQRLDGEADRMLDAARRMREAADVIRHASDEAAAGSQTAAAATEQLGATARDIAGQVARSSEVIAVAARNGQAARDSMARLAEAIKRVASVAGLIDHIASQTNLLALNATIEAARAGEAGRGFAIVAHEVKTLATQTSGSTEEIRKIVEEIGTLGEQCSTNVSSMGEEVGKIEVIVGTIASAVEEQNVATQEIARTVSEAAVAVSRVSGMISGVADDAGLTGDMASVVRSLSSDMSKSVDVMNADIVEAVRRAAAA